GVWLIFDTQSQINYYINVSMTQTWYDSCAGFVPFSYFYASAPAYWPQRIPKKSITSTKAFERPSLAII
ncbi:MAG: hypothetical protein KDK78_08340, partial [Chlamydiia bacterium]|nr:hypothetical protein [Chlamydiia bacterium]